jgi:hypothetical protein
MYRTKLRPYENYQAATVQDAATGLRPGKHRSQTIQGPNKYRTRTMLSGLSPCRHRSVTAPYCDRARTVQGPYRNGLLEPMHRTGVKNFARTHGTHRAIWHEVPQGKNAFSCTLMASKRIQKVGVADEVCLTDEVFKACAYVHRS